MSQTFINQDGNIIRRNRYSQCFFQYSYNSGKSDFSPKKLLLLLICTTILFISNPSNEETIRAFESYIINNIGLFHGMENSEILLSSRLHKINKWARKSSNNNNNYEEKKNFGVLSVFHDKNTNKYLNFNPLSGKSDSGLYASLIFQPRVRLCYFPKSTNDQNELVLTSGGVRIIDTRSESERLEGWVCDFFYDNLFASSSASSSSDSSSSSTKNFFSSMSGRENLSIFHKDRPLFVYRAILGMLFLSLTFNLCGGVPSIISQLHDTVLYCVSSPIFIAPKLVILVYNIMTYPILLWMDSTTWLKDLLCVHFIVYPLLVKMNKIIEKSDNTYGLYHDKVTESSFHFYIGIILFWLVSGFVCNYAVILVTPTVSSSGRFTRGINRANQKWSIYAASLGYILEISSKHSFSSLFSQIFNMSYSKSNAIQIGGGLETTPSMILVIFTAMQIIDLLNCERNHQPILRSLLSWVAGGLLGRALGAFHLEQYTQYNSLLNRFL